MPPLAHRIDTFAVKWMARIPESTRQALRGLGARQAELLTEENARPSTRENRGQRRAQRRTLRDEMEQTLAALSPQVRAAMRRLCRKRLRHVAATDGKPVAHNEAVERPM